MIGSLAEDRRPEDGGLFDDEGSFCGLERVTDGMIGSSAFWVTDGMMGSLAAEDSRQPEDEGLFDDEGSFCGLERGGVAEGRKGASEE